MIVCVQRAMGKEEGEKGEGEAGNRRVKKVVQVQ